MSKYKNYTKRTKVQFYRRDWDVEYYASIVDGWGFQITDPPEVNIDGTKERSLYGPDSPFYGSSLGEEEYKYSCKCGRYKSRMFENSICPHCNHPVVKLKKNIKMTGWLSMGIYRIINPYYYHKMQQLFGDAFTEIVNIKYRVNKNGLREKASIEELGVDPSTPFIGIGIDEFYVRFEEIMNFFKNKYKKSAKKIRSIDRLIQEKHAVFTSHIPFYTPDLRVSTTSGDTFYFVPINKLIHTCCNLVFSLQDSYGVELDYTVQRIQDKVNKMWDQNFELFTGKEGHIRGVMIGGSMDYTARNVIVPDPTLRDNEFDISYHTFRIIFKYRIIFYIMKIYSTILKDAETMWKRSFIFDERVYDVMLYILENDRPKSLLNRNPTLNFFSLLLLRIRNIQKDDFDYTLSVPLSILPGLNADFDGDILNLLASILKSMSYMLRKFDPITRMIINRETGDLNSYFMIQKSQMIDIYRFCTVENATNDIPELPDPENETELL